MGDRVSVARERLREYLRGRGLRATRQRDRVLEAFLADAAHASVDEIYDRARAGDPAIGHATVYRAMGLFVAAGIAKERRFHADGRVRYEPALDVDHHDHLVCTRCGDIQEFENPAIERLQEEVAAARGFAVAYHRLELYGLCARCRAGEKGPEKSLDEQSGSRV